MLELGGIGMKTTKTIKGTLLKTIILIFIIIVVVFSTLTGISMSRTTRKTLDTTLTEIGVLAADAVSAHILRFNTLLTDMASANELQNPEITEQEKIAFMDGKNSQYHDEYGSDFFYADKNGDVLKLGINITDRVFFQKGIAGESYLSDPIIRKDTGTLGYTYVVPVRIQNEVIGIVYMIIDYNNMYNIVSGITINGQGDAYLVNKDGTTVVYSDEQMVIDAYNTAAESKTDSDLTALAGIEASAINGETGFDSYTYNGKSSFAAYAPVPNTDGWGIIVTAKQQGFLKDTYNAIVITVAVAILLAIMGIVVLNKRAKEIAIPLQKMTKRMLLLSKGDLESPIENCSSNNEIEILNTAMSDTIETLRSYVGNISNVTSEMANRNFQVSIDIDYIGNFSTIKTALEEIVVILNKSLSKINENAQRVSESSNAVSSVSQTLASGTSEQAGAVEELLATVENISVDLKTSVQESQNAVLTMRDIETKTQVGNDQMKVLIQTMEKISSSSMEIGNIINTIEEIAEQTNLLALNASIEAARAGDAGKGFAVVADEIGKLASQSANAVKTTRELIEAALNEIKGGNTATNETAVVLEKISQGILHAVEIVEVTSNGTITQSNMMEEINTAIGQISDVVSSNLETSEKSSEVSEILLTQSEQLTNLVEEFKLK